MVDEERQLLIAIVKAQAKLLRFLYQEQEPEQVPHPDVPEPRESKPERTPEQDLRRKTNALEREMAVEQLERMLE